MAVLTQVQHCTGSAVSLKHGCVDAGSALYRVCSTWSLTSYSNLMLLVTVLWTTWTSYIQQIHNFSLMKWCSAVSVRLSTSSFQS